MTTIISLGALDSGATSRTTINANFASLNAAIPAGTLVDTTSVQTLTNKVLTAPTIATITNTGILTLPTSTDTLVGRATTDTLTNKTLTSPVIATPSFSTSIPFGAHTAYFTETDNGNSSTAKTIDWTTSNKQKVTLTGNCTFTFTAPPGPCNLVLKVLTGAGSFTGTWPAAVHWTTSPTVTTTASKADIFTFYYDGSTYFGAYSQNYTP